MSLQVMTTALNSSLCAAVSSYSEFYKFLKLNLVLKKFIFFEISCVIFEYFNFRKDFGKIRNEHQMVLGFETNNSWLSIIIGNQYLNKNEESTKIGYMSAGQLKKCS